MNTGDSIPADTRVTQTTMQLCIGPSAWRYGGTPTAGDKYLLIDLPQADADVNTLLVSLSDCVGRSYSVMDVMGGLVCRPALTVAPFENYCASAEVRAALPGTSGLMPLFVFGRRAHSLRIFSQIRIGERDALFVAVADPPDRSISEAATLAQAINATEKNRRFLNNHQFYYRKFHPGIEIEHKITIAPEVDTFDLAVELRNAIGYEGFTGFLWEYGDVFQQWDFDNVMFDIPGPPPEAGYVSFIPDSTGSYVMKRKWFPVDALERREKKWIGIDVSPEDFLSHVRSTQGVDAVYLGSFRRTRFDISCESARSGNVYAIMVDRCVMIEPDGADLCQVEIEYLHSRTIRESAADRINAEMSDLVDATTDFLHQRDVAHRVGVLSKRSYLQSLHGAEAAASARITSPADQARRPRRTIG